MKVDNGGAPNPWFNVCTLAICKPKIRKHAQIGDYIVGFGSKNDYSIDKSDHIIYIMKVTQKLTYHQYYQFCQNNLKNKIPNSRNKLGDCIYFLKNKKYNQIKNQYHDNSCYSKDISSDYVLLSDDFLYFGRESIKVKNSLRNIIIKYQGHKSISNQPYLQEFEEWFIDLKHQYASKNKIIGQPHYYYKNKVSVCK